MKLHPVSAVVRGLQRGLVLASFVFFLGIGAEFVPIGNTGLLIAALVPVAVVAGLGYQIAYYYRFEYELTDDTFDIASGVFGRKQREIPYRRVQNVDLTESLFHRLLGVAVVQIETAGGAETEAALNFVTADEARRLQREIRRRRAAVRDNRTADVAEGAAGADPAEARTTGDPEAGTAVEGDRAEPGTGDEPGTATRSRPEDRGPTPIFALDPAELVLLALTSFRPAAVLFLLFGLPLVQDIFLGVVAGILGIDPAAIGVRDTPGITLLIGVVLVVLGVLASWAISAVVTFLEYYGFTLGRQGDDLVYERGLLQRYSGSIPTDKVQTLTIKENVAMRALGYAGFSVETAGYGPGQGSQGSQSAIPLARRDRAFSLARDLEPFGDLSFTRPPKRARRRYAVRFLLVVLALTAVFGALAVYFGDRTLWLPPLVLVPLVPPAAHLRWKHRGYHAGESHFVVRDGFWRRTTRVVPYYRLQTVIRERTIFQRRLDLAHLTADTASSSFLGGRGATAYDIEDGDARRLYGHNRERLVASLRGNPRDRTV